jgi:regulator of protease activity HflC (stomatin/prohibitin superfamily)
VIYKITNLIKYLTSTEDSDQFMIEACEAAIRHIVTRVPFDDLVNDSDVVEEAIGSKITEICKDIGIRVKRYRFQDIEITDPIGRALASMRAMAPKLTESAKQVSERLNISHKDALIVLSPNIQFVADILNIDPREIEAVPEEENES